MWLNILLHFTSTIISNTCYRTLNLWLPWRGDQRTILSWLLLVHCSCGRFHSNLVEQSEATRYVVLWRAKCGWILIEWCLLQGHRGPVAHIAMDGSQTLMATASVDKSVKVWDIEGGYCTHSFTGHRYVGRMNEYCMVWDHRERDDTLVLKYTPC